MAHDAPTLHPPPHTRTHDACVASTRGCAGAHLAVAGVVAGGAQGKTVNLDQLAPVCVDGRDGRAPGAYERCPPPPRAHTPARGPPPRPPPPSHYHRHHNHYHH